MTFDLAPGQIWFADLEPSGRRPVIILSRLELNRGKTVVVVACTTRKFQERSKLPNCFPIHAGTFGMPEDCVAAGEFVSQIAVGQLDLDAGAVGELDEIAYRGLVRAVGYAIGSDCEPA